MFKLKMYSVCGAAVLFCMASMSAPVFAHPFSEAPVTDALVVESFKKMADDNPDDINIQYEYAETLLNAGMLDESLAVLKGRVLSREPGHGLGNFILFEIYYRKGKYRDSLSALEKIRDLALAPDVLAAEASAWRALKNPKKALQCARASVKLDGGNAEGYLQAGLALIELRDGRGAMAQLEKSLDFSMDRMEVYVVLKQLYDKMLKPEQQLKKLREIAARDGDGGVFSEQVAKDIEILEKQVASSRKK